MITLLPPNHLRRQQRSDGGYDMVPAYTADEVRSHMLSYAENRVAEERERCARMCEEQDEGNTLTRYDYRRGALDCADMIRKGVPT